MLVKGTTGSKVPGASMGSTWVGQDPGGWDPGGSHADPRNLAIWVMIIQSDHPCFNMMYYNATHLQWILTHYGVIDLAHHLFRSGPAFHSEPSYNLSHWWFITPWMKQSAIAINIKISATTTTTFENDTLVISTFYPGAKELIII